MSYTKKPDLTTKVGKYFLAKRAGKNKKEAELEAYGKTSNHSSAIEATKTYQVIEKRYYKDFILEKLSLEQMADEHLKVLRQDKELGPKLKAIEMAKDYIEPESASQDEHETVVFVLKK